jgi:hypothetical protein
MVRGHYGSRTKVLLVLTSHFRVSAEPERVRRKASGSENPSYTIFTLAVHPYCWFGTPDSLFPANPRGIINPVEARRLLSPHNFHIRRAMTT